MGFFRKAPPPSLDWVRFDTKGYEARGEPKPGCVRAWFSPDGDGVGLYLFTISPDLPRVESVDALRSFYSTGVKEVGGAVVETAVLRVCGLPVVQVISKLPQRPSGLTYVGALTIPRRDFSFVLKVQCAERGPTGFREAILFDRLAKRELPTMRGPMAQSDWNPDAPEFDPEFPEHPVSRTRRLLAGIRSSLAIDPLLSERPAFPLPPARD